MDRDFNWKPAQWNSTTRKLTTSLEVGDLVALDRSAWRVHKVELRPEVDVSDRRPYTVVLRPIDVDPTISADSADLHLAAASFAGWHSFPDEHYPVCASCGEVQPCREQAIREEVEKAANQMRRYEIPGVCPACEEPVTKRHTRQTWPENLVAMTGEPVTFHLRQKCIGEAIRYDKQWTAAGHQSELGYQNDTTTKAGL